MTPARVPLPRPRPAVALARFAIAALIFALLAADLRLQGPITSADAAVSLWLHQQNHPALTAFMVGVSRLHGTLAILGMVAIAAAFLARMQLYEWLLPLLLSVPGGMLLNEAIKHWFQRARPVFEGRLVDLASFSFPSGHAAGATVWWGFVLILWLAWRKEPLDRSAGCVLATGMVLLVAVSRVYLGAHHGSDVLAAIAEGCAWLALCFGVASQGRIRFHRRIRP